MTWKVYGDGRFGIGLSMGTRGAGRSTTAPRRTERQVDVEVGMRRDGGWPARVVRVTVTATVIWNDINEFPGTWDRGAKSGLLLRNSGLGVIINGGGF